MPIRSSLVEIDRDKNLKNVAVENQCQKQFHEKISLKYNTEVKDQNYIVYALIYYFKIVRISKPVHIDTNRSKLFIYLKFEN